MNTILLVTALAASANIQSYGYEAAEVKESVLDGAFSESLPWFPVTAAARALPAPARAQAVKLLAGFVKSYTQSADFKSAYAARLETVRAPRPSPKKPYAQLAKEKRAEMDKQVADVEASIGMLPKELQAEARRNTAEMRKAFEGMLEDRAALEQQEELRFEAEEQAYRESLERYSDDPSPAIKQLLERFLAETAGIDYSAKLKAGPYGKQVFVDPQLEGKSGHWKMGYRAGREATEAARSFVQGWLKELK